jgi:hypothetical protein
VSAHAFVTMVERCQEPEDRLRAHHRPSMKRIGAGCPSATKMKSSGGLPGPSRHMSPWPLPCWTHKTFAAARRMLVCSPTETAVPPPRSARVAACRLHAPAEEQGFLAYVRRHTRGYLRTTSSALDTRAAKAARRATAASMIAARTNMWRQQGPNSRTCTCAFLWESGQLLSSTSEVTTGYCHRWRYGCKLTSFHYSLEPIPVGQNQGSSDRGSWQSDSLLG